MRRHMLAALAGLWSLSGCTPATGLHPAAGTASPAAIVWKAEDIGGGGIIDRSHVTLALGRDAMATGSASCNRYTARYVLTGERLTITGIASTRKACAPALMEQEARYIGLLEQVAHWRIEPTGALVLTTMAGAPLRFFPDEPAQPR